MINKWGKQISMFNIVILLVAIIAPLAYIQNTKAASLNLAMIRTDRMAASTATTGTVCVKPTAPAGTENKVVVTFPASFTVGASGTWTVDTSYTAGWPTGATAWLVTSPTAVPASKTVTFTSPDLTVGTMYCFNWNLTTAINTGATTGTLTGASIETQDAGSVTIDKSSVQLYVLATSDQVSVTGAVAPTFSMTLSSNAAPLGTIANSVVNASTTPAVGVVTNARNGWIAWVSDANNGSLNSVGASANIPAPVAPGAASIDLATKAATTGAYGLGITATGGSPTLDPAYVGTTAGYAGTLSSSFRPIAYSSTFSSADQITLIVRAVAKTTQAPASDYADTITVIAAGQF